MRYYINVALLVVTLNKWGSLVRQLDTEGEWKCWMSQERGIHIKLWSSQGGNKYYDMQKTFKCE